jgi:hypothetical protein
MPTSRGRNQLDALSITIPRCANTKPNFARSLASRMSIGSVIVTPTPTAAPLIAAIRGLVEANRRSASSPPLSRRRAASSPASNGSGPDRSIPAQNARPAR